jgi:hypothetical protein
VWAVDTSLSNNCINSFWMSAFMLPLNGMYVMIARCSISIKVAVSSFPIEIVYYPRERKPRLLRGHGLWDFKVSAHLRHRRIGAEKLLEGVP